MASMIQGRVGADLKAKSDKLLSLYAINRGRNAGKMKYLRDLCKIRKSLEKRKA